MFNLPSLYEMGIMLPAIVLGLTFHELAHGWVADRLGDATARYQGRLTLNPLAHVDVIGLIMLFAVGFGWAKPVPVNPYNFRGDMRQGIMLVSLAGPAANMLLAIAGSVALGLGAWKLPYGQDIVLKIIYINVILAVFNLLPVPPLDGSKILAGLWSGQQQWLYTLENYGTIILLLLLFTGIIGKVLRWIIVPLYHTLIGLAKAVAFLVS
ncbi:site-2 protease family protein [Desulfofundulus thermosubterraneus]|uniref:Zn-dependent protease (Includes SpoIVFB) n=1 Tax=Desulfofundulus thermosubterraneus DSM 16057 TaxID=1121432 RepID=A0A1M6HEZ2_9FIRM|nr:site-2 protease family protein [Desulfofundulus thermosubterraneus]SHJ20713.1 Zn-dependent protease (includes SpoIVFB) [Desulfofundulus thermosubterraneus DSM 16057]